MNSASWHRNTYNIPRVLILSPKNDTSAKTKKLEEVRLKKLKLRLKDQMQSIERQYRQQYGIQVA